MFLIYLKTATTEMQSRLHLFKNYKYVTIINTSLLVCGMASHNLGCGSQISSAGYKNKTLNTEQ
jgi:hypothetical protein